MIRFITIIFTIFLLGLYSSNACKCEPVHVQTQYCSSDFTILMIPHKGLLTCDENYIMYDIVLEAIYRTANVTQNDEEILLREKVYTPKKDDCNIEFDLYEEYIASGKIIGDKPIITACDYVKKMEDTNNYHLAGFLGYYDDTCKCSICVPGYNCGKKRKVCKLALDDSWECLGEYATCKDKKDHCEWEGHEGIDECYKVSNRR